jgi:hypothetical protein
MVLLHFHSTNLPFFQLFLFLVAFSQPSSLSLNIQGHNMLENESFDDPVMRVLVLISLRTVFLLSSSDTTYPTKLIASNTTSTKRKMVPQRLLLHNPFCFVRNICWATFLASIATFSHHKPFGTPSSCSSSRPVDILFCIASRHQLVLSCRFCEFFPLPLC